MRIRFNWMFVLGMITILMWQCAENPLEPNLGSVHEVSISNTRFNPTTLTISVGDQVRWTNNSTEPHSVDSGTFQHATSKFIGTTNIDPNDSSIITFSTADNFPYYCALHTMGTVKQGTIIVN